MRPCPKESRFSRYNQSIKHWSIVTQSDYKVERDQRLLAVDCRLLSAASGNLLINTLSVQSQMFQLILDSVGDGFPNLHLTITRTKHTPLYICVSNRHILSSPVSYNEF